VIATAKPIDAPTRTADKSRKRRFAIARARVFAQLHRGIPGALGSRNRRFPRHARGAGRPSAGDAYLCAPRGEGPFFVARARPGAVLAAHSEKGPPGKPNGVATGNRAEGYAGWRSVSECE
jgi:hypothetical protein